MYTSTRATRRTYESGTYTSAKCGRRPRTTGTTRPRVVYLSVDNTTVVTARLTEDEARMLVELARPSEKASAVLRRLVREAYERRRGQITGP